MTDDHLLLFARFPEAGRVKTRLAATTSPAFAAELYALCARQVLQALGGVSATRTVWVADAADVPRMRDWVGEGWRVRPQPEGGLTDRLEQAFKRSFEEGAARVLVTATDTPGLHANRITHALGALDHHDAVIGPATDGGYYLLGLRRPSTSVFRDIDWSTSVVAEQTRARLQRDGLSVSELPVLADLDTEADLRAWMAEHADAPLSRWVRADGRLSLGQG